jgi:hypothetical protein
MFTECSLNVQWTFTSLDVSPEIGPIILVNFVHVRSCTLITQHSNKNDYSLLYCMVFTHALTVLYFIRMRAAQGVLGLSRLAVSFFLKDELNLSPSTVRKQSLECSFTSAPYFMLASKYGTNR